jgi:hypothetical protein
MMTGELRGAASIFSITAAVEKIDTMTATLVSIHDLRAAQAEKDPKP